MSADVPSARAVDVARDPRAGRARHDHPGHAGDDNVIYGDGKFSGASGTARLSGSVNLSELDSDGLITFDCIFVLDVGSGG